MHKNSKSMAINTSTTTDSLFAAILINESYYFNILLVIMYV